MKNIFAILTLVLVSSSLYASDASVFKYTDPELRKILEDVELTVTVIDSSLLSSEREVKLHFARYRAILHAGGWETHNSCEARKSGEGEYFCQIQNMDLADVARTFSSKKYYRLSVSTSAGKACDYLEVGKDNISIEESGFWPFKSYKASVLIENCVVETL